MEMKEHKTVEEAPSFKGQPLPPTQEAIPDKTDIHTTSVPHPTAQTSEGMSHGEHQHKEHAHTGEHQHTHTGEHQHTHTGEHHHKEHHTHTHHHKEHTQPEKIIKQVTEFKIDEKEVNHHYVYCKQPTDQFTEDVFRFEETPIPRDPSSENEILVRLTYISIDPFIRNRMSENSRFIQPFRLNDIMEGEATAEIIKSNNPKYPVGQNIIGYLNWTKYQIINTKNCPVNVIPQDINPSCFLSLFGTPGLTAYFGITEYSKLKPQNNVLISGACGSVGLFVSQIMRIMGCNQIIGLDSSEEKIKQSKLFGFNDCHNSTSKDLDQVLRTAFPEGIDIYWDNVGGSTLDVVIEHMRPHGRIIMCGTISHCQNEQEKFYGITKFDSIIAKSITIQGLFYAEFCDRFPKAYKKLLHWYNEGKIKTKETTLEGFHNVPQAFTHLFSGDTMGKTIVHVEQRPAQVA
jgi:NADPH-dependent curcumin reductase CurA